MMPAAVSHPLVLLLHDGGWDEVIMVAAGLLVAYLVIVWTGRRKSDEDDDLDLLDEDASEAPGDTPATDRPKRRQV